MWIEGNYRRNLMDMHIDDWNPEFLSRIDIDEYVDALKDAGVQAAMVKGGRIRASPIIPQRSAGCMRG